MTFLQNKDRLHKEKALQKQKKLKKLLQPQNLSRRSSNEREALYKELARTDKILSSYDKIEKTEAALKESRLLLKTEEDPDFSGLVQEEIEKLSLEKKRLEEWIQKQTASSNPLDGKNVIMEVRPAAGGEEAGLFAAELFSAYQAFALKKKWKVEVMSMSFHSFGGLREAVAGIKGEEVYGFLKYESGVHRVQRVPKTETQGRVHTSTVTVVVLPEADPLELKIPEQDIRIDIQRAGGPGGQHVNTTDSAVRAVHLPTKITVYCQQEKSQRANRERALRILYARVWDHARQKEERLRSAERKSLMGAGERSQKIRTYNFPQSRLTDHRIPLTLKTLPLIMKGDLDPVLSALRKTENTSS